MIMVVGVVVVVVVVVMTTTTTTMMMMIQETKFVSYSKISMFHVSLRFVLCAE
jgi:hypothetical protein